MTMNYIKPFLQALVWLHSPALSTLLVICSMKWPMEDMPFSESGMQPDILFNPHGFPSRMTIGMCLQLLPSAIEVLFFAPNY